MTTPILSANLYASDSLDQVVAAWLLRLREDSARIGLEADFWILRYARGGEHLKLRIMSGDEDALERLRPLVITAAQDCLASLPARLEAPKAGKSPPIDPEDAEELPIRDRELVFTTFRPEPVVFGPEPFPKTENYVNHAVRCLVESTKIVMDLFAARYSSEAQLAHSVRQGAVVQAALDAIATLPPERRCAYLDYHRGWLLRSAAHGSPRAAKNLQRRFVEIRETRAGALQPIAESLEQIDSRPGSSWGASVAALLEVASKTFPELRPDPFGGDAVYAALFKSLHAFANQIGLRTRDEALTYDLIYQLWSERHPRAA